MAANFINFVNSMTYGDAGAAELGLPAATNHMNWTLDHLTVPAASRGDDFINHHILVMLARYEQWRSNNGLPPVRAWNGTDIFREPGMMPMGATLPPELSGGPFPAGWTMNDLGTRIEDYYDNDVRNHTNFMHGGTELDDEVKAPFSVRYWAFMKWASDLRRRFLGLQVFPVGVVYDRDGTILSEKEFFDNFHQVHHVWHPNGGEPSWTEPTPYFATGVGQYRRKKQLSRTQIGEEFFQFHRDHLEVLDRWMERTGLERVQSFNTCGHDLSGGFPGPAPAGLDHLAGGMGYPLVDYTTRNVDFTPPHQSNWEGTLPGFDGKLGEFPSVGAMGQHLAEDFNPFPAISVPGAASSDTGYHAEGHVLNGDLYWPVANNYSIRFYGWHGFIDDVWRRRAPELLTFSAEGFPADARLLTIVRDVAAGTDTVEPAGAIPGIDLTTGDGTVRIRLKVRTDPFNRPLKLTLTCEVLDEATSSVPVITQTRALTIVPGAPGAADERQQNTDFLEDFVLDGTGAFLADNFAFSPTSVGFVNSLVRVTAHLTSERRPSDNTPYAVSGTISSSGTTVTGSGTNFGTAVTNLATDQVPEGSRIRANGEVRTVISVSGPTSLIVDKPFTSDLPAGTAYARLDGFDAIDTLEIPLVQEKLAPDVTVYLDRSSFSKDQVDAVAIAGVSEFTDAFYVVVQDRTNRPAPIVWPSDAKTDMLLPQFKGLIAPPLRAAGLYTDAAHYPQLALVDAADNVIPGTAVEVTSASPEDPSLHPSVPQRVTYRAKVTFTGNAMFAGIPAGSFEDVRLRVQVDDRCGNRRVDTSSNVRLLAGENPYMLDGETSWLSMDTRAFQIRQGDTKFGVTMGTDPHAFITAVVNALRSGSGIADGETFEGLPDDQPGSALEYSPQVNGTNVYNFALCQARLQSVTGATGVRVGFRLFRWGTANVAYSEPLAYHRAPSGVPLLGRTTTNELASIPFFASPRVGTSALMTSQPDPLNETDFAAGTETKRWFGAYLDVNEDTPRYPETYVGDGPFDALPPSSLRSIRDLMIGHHQCMVTEIVYATDPTVDGSTPGTSDNLSQRNLLILQTANPGSASTRTVQHAFNVDLTRKWRHTRGRTGHKLALRPGPDPDSHHHEHPAPHHDGPHHGGGHQPNDPACGCFDCCVADAEALMPQPARPAEERVHAPHSLHFFAPQQRAELETRVAEQTTGRWRFDLEQWKRTDGVDELVFLWNDLPADAVVDIHLPAADATEIINYRNLRHAPGTVRLIDAQTLRLKVAGTTYLPVPPFWGDNLAGLITVTLPAEASKFGARYRVDVLQMRSERRRVLGGFQLNIQVGKARDLYAQELRTLELFHRRLSLMAKNSRWRPIVEKQVEFTRQRAKGFIELANEPGVTFVDPTVEQQGQKVRLVLEKIQIVNRHEPWFKGSRGEFRVLTDVASDDNGGQWKRTTIPSAGHVSVSDKPGLNILELNLPVFEGFVQDDLAVEIAPTELDLFDPDDRLPAYRRVFSGPPESWLGQYGPGDETIEPEDLRDWRVWYRVERA